MIEITKNFRVLSRSSNLRGIVRYAGKFSVRRVSAIELRDGSGSLYVAFADGAAVTTHFASYTVLLRWIARRQGWPNAETLAA